MRTSRVGSGIFTAAIVASMSWLIWTNASAGSYPRSYFRQLMTGSLEPLPAWCVMVDQRITELSRGHSVLIRFTGWDFRDEAQWDYAVTLFRRGNYAICPNRVYMAVDGHLELPPITAQWLADHDVRTIEWIVASKDDRLWSRIYQIQPGQEAPAEPPPRPAITSPWDENFPL